MPGQQDVVDYLPVDGDCASKLEITSSSYCEKGLNVEFTLSGSSMWVIVCSEQSTSFLWFSPSSLSENNTNNTHLDRCVDLLLIIKETSKCE